MPIIHRSEKEPALAAATGRAVGEAEVKKQQAEMQQKIDWERESEIRANQLKMEMQEAEIRQQFLNEQRRKQIEIDREIRAHEWETEKMELRSRLEFEKEEKARQKRYERFTNQMTEAKTKFIEQNTPPDQQQAIEVEIARNYEGDGFTEVDEILGREALRERERKEARNIEEVNIRKWATQYVGLDRANLTPLDQLIKDALEVQARMGEKPVMPAFEGAGAGMTYPHTPTNLTTTPEQPQIATPTTEDEYNALPAGTRYVHPDGTIKVKG